MSSLNFIDIVILVLYKQGRMAEEARDIDFIESRAVSDSTRDGYRRCNSVLLKWISSNHASCIENDKINMHMVSLPIIKEFLLERYKSTNCTKTNIGRYKAAIRFLFLNETGSVPQWWEKGLALFMKGLANIEADERQRGIRSLQEGKMPLQFGTYQKISELMMFSGDTFAHLYLLLTWNLMCRTNSTASLTMNHIDWVEDSLLVFFSKTKNDQAGDSLGDPRHCYANPTCPSICVVLSLGMFEIHFFAFISCCISVLTKIFIYSKFRFYINSYLLISLRPRFSDFVSRWKPVKQVQQSFR
jgi:integrase